MNHIKRLMTSICSENLHSSKEFYTTLFNLNVAFDSDWFVQLTSQDGSLELGIVARQHDIVPKEAQTHPQGFYFTFVVDNADEVCKLAQDKAFSILKAPHDTFYGQRRLLLKDPDGCIVDVSSPIENFEF